ncbi:MAG: sugar phosphate isomerase/epimerase [Planctomycetota bacterium]|nr:sugar phosphate isomerase/epimerase [Planctomycetota bacterium]
MLWGYAGVFPGAFNVWKGDPVMNKLRFAAEHGFKSTALGLGEMKDPARRDQIAQFVADHDLRISTGAHLKWLSDDFETLRRGVEDFIQDLEAYGPLLRTPIVTTGAGAYHRFMRAPSLAEQLDRLAEIFTPLARACHQMGRPFGIENHGDYYCSDLVELCKRVPHLGIFLDTGNTYLIGEQSVAACKLAAPYTIGTHFKDHVVHPDPKTLTFVIEGAPLGEGDVGLREIYLDLIQRAPNPRGLVLQWEMVPPKTMDPFECLERSWSFVKTLPEAA